MQHRRTWGALVVGLASLAAPALGQRIKITDLPQQQKVEVSIDGQPFTAYVYPASLKKPVLYPLRAASGTEVTRGYPLAPRPGERVDHPHHAGLWFNFGHVNGHDFWNNSTAIDPSHPGPFGSIAHRRVVKTKNGDREGRLEVETEWLDQTGQPILRETTTFIFTGEPNFRAVERQTKLVALAQPVVFKDNKEGLLALRVARALEAPADKPEVFTDASGQATTVPVLDNTGVTGSYQNSEGLAATSSSGSPVWGQPAKWVALTGQIGNEALSLVLMDHPDNLNHPARWHARGYGLFAVNNLGAKVFDPAQPEFTLTLAPGKTLAFKHKLLILNKKAPKAEIDQAWAAFAR
ncbi:MAG: PmoA family protein [Bernardetiaceae bacterium]|nr:PmoA family protein [Bernardetiaceae bacterium]